MTIDLTKAYKGTIIRFQAGSAGKHDYGFIEPDDEELKKYVTDLKTQYNIKHGYTPKTHSHPGNILFILPQSEGDTFKPCATNEYGLRWKERVSFRVRLDPKGLPQAYEVRKIVQPTITVSSPKKNDGPYVDPVLEKIRLNLGKLAMNLPKDEDFEEEEEGRGGEDFFESRPRKTHKETYIPAKQEEKRRPKPQPKEKRNKNILYDEE